MIITLSTENNIIKIIQFQYNIIRIDFKHLRARPSCLPKRNEKSCSKYEKLLKRCPSRKALAKAKAKIIHPGRHPWRHVSLWSQCDLNGSSLHLFCYQRLSRNATETHVKWQSIIKLRGKRTISAIGNLKAPLLCSTLAHWRYRRYQPEHQRSRQCCLCCSAQSTKSLLWTSSAIATEEIRSNNTTASLTAHGHT